MNARNIRTFLDSKAAGWAAFGLVGVILLAMWAINAAQGSSDGRQLTETNARAICRTAVKQQLKNPDSATFSDETYRAEGDTYVGGGTVRAENSFGGTAIHTFTCTASISAGDIIGVAKIQR